MRAARTDIKKLPQNNSQIIENFRIQNVYASYLQKWSYMKAKLHYVITLLVYTLEVKDCLRYSSSLKLQHKVKALDTYN